MTLARTIGLAAGIAALALPLAACTAAQPDDTTQGAGSGAVGSSTAPDPVHEVVSRDTDIRPEVSGGPLVIRTVAGDVACVLNPAADIPADGLLLDGPDLSGCQLFAGSAPAELPECTPGDGRSVGIFHDMRGSSLACLNDDYFSRADARVLAPGESASTGTLTCVAESAGLRCTDSERAGGFVIAPEGSRLL